jgi:protease I
MLGVGVFDQQQCRVDDLGDVVTRDVGRHAHGDSGRTVGQEIRKQAREDFGLFLLAVVGRVEIDSALVEPGHQPDRGLGQPRFGIAVGGGIIPVDVPEIALPFDQRIAQREILGEPDHCIVDRLVAVRMVLADHVADHAGRFLEGVGGVELQLPHRPQQAAVDRLQPVAQVGQRTRRDRRQGIDQIALRKRGIERRIDDGIERVGIGSSGHHGAALATALRAANPPEPHDPPLIEESAPCGERRMTKRVLILATDGFEQSELIEPKRALEDVGIETVVASPNTRSIRGWRKDDWGDSVAVDAALDSVSAEDFDALLLPGGQMNPDKLRMDDKAVDLVEAFNDAAKPIAAICHGPWLLVEADVVDGKTVTGWPSIHTDLENAGAEVVDQEVAIDGNLITSRNPDDIPAFSRALIEALSE